jgi:ADP-ribose pyrophosphatase YjhB (NUDIX family)
MGAMAIPKMGTSSEGEPMHYSVGALIERDGKYLLIDRKNPPLGFAGLSGHIDSGESPEVAIVREVAEESGLSVIHTVPLFEEEISDNVCGRGISVHYWYVFRCDFEGEPVLDATEAQSMSWYAPEELRLLPLEPVWRHWFEKLELL